MRRPTADASVSTVHTPSGELLVGAVMDDMEEELPSLAASGPATIGCGYTPATGTPPWT
ncbi:hypothetical protein GR925_22800 [Streptomyces sp. HUCO-GS316]|uniref:hypothetical protein n=1 Tax=Streptomyces sp. HUCO-GS316 TaxID=2692198 RepID=UPI0013705422|nr:hypothetical protein [Streptomyces sp. HUCO-GS316]MXM66186.1 hypothetical protein [Streptomyces sp. HUCO-GS316]